MNIYGIEYLTKILCLVDLKKKITMPNDLPPIITNFFIHLDLKIPKLSKGNSNSWALFPETWDMTPCFWQHAQDLGHDFDNPKNLGMLPGNLGID